MLFLTLRSLKNVELTYDDMDINLLLCSRNATQALVADSSNNWTPQFKVFPLNVRNKLENGAAMYVSISAYISDKSDISITQEFETLRKITVNSDGAFVTTDLGSVGDTSSIIEMSALYFSDRSNTYSMLLELPYDDDGGHTYEATLSISYIFDTEFILDSSDGE